MKASTTAPTASPAAPNVSAAEVPTAQPTAGAVQEERAGDGTSGRQQMSLLWWIWTPMKSGVLAAAL